MTIAPELSSLPLFLLLVLPGLISMHVYRLLMPARDIDWKTALVEALFYGTLNFALCLPIIIPIHRGRFIEDHAVWYGVLMVTVLVLTPVLWPVLLRLLYGWRWLFSRLQLPFPTAWDYYFGLRNRCFVLIHLKNGTMIGGYYGVRSYATSYPRQGDIYLEKVVRVDEKGCFEEFVDETAGMLITKDTYDYMEFFSERSPAE